MRKHEAVARLRPSPATLRRLEQLLTDELSAEAEHMVGEVAAGRASLDDYVEWLEHAPATWQEYQDLCTRHATKGWLRAMTRGFVLWEDVEASARDQEPQTIHEDTRRAAMASAPACPSCRRSPGELRWVYYKSEPWTRREGRGVAGWVGICDRCRLQVEFRPMVLQLMPNRPSAGSVTV
jgi:hypothetical protein